MAIPQGQGELTTPSDFEAVARLRFQRNKIVFPSAWISSSLFYIYFIFLSLFVCLQSRLSLLRGARKPFYHFYHFLRFCISRNLCRVMTTGWGLVWFWFWDWVWSLGSDSSLSWTFGSHLSGSRAQGVPGFHLLSGLKPHLIDTPPLHSSVFAWSKMHLGKRVGIATFWVAYCLTISQSLALDF